MTRTNRALLGLFTSTAVAGVLAAQAHAQGQAASAGTSDAQLLGDVVVTATRQADTVNRVPLSLLRGIDPMRNTLFENTLRFARGLPANNALLWGVRGMGKSSLVKAVHREIPGLKLVEIHREDLGSMPRLLAH